MSLTPKQEAFAQAVASGMTQADAYRSAYSTNNQKPETVQNNAYMLMQNSEVSARVEELRAEVAQLHLWTREDSIRALKSVIAEPDKVSDITSAVKELNAMHGFNAPIKQEINGSMAHTIAAIELIGVKPGESTN
jgi:flagellar basal body P-ring protein FlgI